MNILVINCGSSSLKFQLINMNDENIIAKGIVERIGTKGSLFKYYSNKEKEIVIEEEINNHKEAMSLVISTLTDSIIGVINNINEISAVGHRVVHGGEYFSGSVIINDEIINLLEECTKLAPLHNPPNLMGIRACKEIMPDAPMVGVFDTAFHYSIPQYAYMYAIPYELYDKYKIRKFGFHGTSHKYVFQRAVKILGKDESNVKVITCHLGNGSSISAIKNGICIDTSMGFTPLAGLPMGTRCGDIDPAIILFLMEKEGLDLKEINDLLNKKSGMLGLSQVSNDFRDIEEASQNGNKKAQLALDVFCYSVKKYISSYIGIMGGIDALVFTAGVGENSQIVREKSVEGLEFLGISIDKDKNKIRGKEIDISKEGSKVKVLVIPTNEELMIAKETQMLVG